eukprot:TRINITY_DN2738_c0_g1_i1.p1 TRINITY_DN2738_c0_g1~~TRINITY_DN2738_c0_g1_i1.p1  ORF type:complete len:631 (-),score=120.08 TRINITY_DN2738_c0_g1_i1:42-1934(-)
MASPYVAPGAGPAYGYENPGESPSNVHGDMMSPELAVPDMSRGTLQTGYSGMSAGYYSSATPSVSGRYYGMKHSTSILTDRMVEEFNIPESTKELEPAARAAYQSITRLSKLNREIEGMLVNFEGKIHIIERKRESLAKAFKNDRPLLEKTEEGVRYIELMENFIIQIDDGIRIVKAAEHAKPYLIAGEPLIQGLEDLLAAGERTEVMRIWDKTKKERKDNSVHGVYNHLRDVKYKGVPNVERYNARYRAMKRELYPAQHVHLTHTRDKVFDPDFIDACTLAQKGKRMVSKARDHCRNGEVDLAIEAWRQGRQACIQLQTETQHHDIIEVKTALTMYDRLRGEIEDRIEHLKTRKPKPVEALVKQHARASERLRKETEAKEAKRRQELEALAKKNMQRKSKEDAVLGRAKEVAKIKKRNALKVATQVALATQGTRVIRAKEEARRKKEEERKAKEEAERKAKEEAAHARLARKAGRTSSTSTHGGSEKGDKVLNRPSTTDRNIASVADLEVELLFRRVTEGRSFESGDVPPPPKPRRGRRGKGKKAAPVPAPETDPLEELPPPDYNDILESARDSVVDVAEDPTPVYTAPKPSKKILEKHPGAEIPIRPPVRRAKHETAWNLMTREHTGY